MWAEVLTGVLLSVAVAAKGVDDPFRVDGRRPEGGWIGRADAAASAQTPATEMGRVVSGVWEVLDRPRIAELLRCRTSRAAPPNPGGVVVATVHMTTRRHPAAVAVTLLLLDDGTPIARPAGAGGGGMRLDPKRFAEILASWPRYLGGFEAADTPRSGPVGQPYAASTIRLIQAAARTRLYGSMPVVWNEPDRLLAAETMHLRLPIGYHPRDPAGLVVWSSPTPDGRIPRVFDVALDEFGLVAVGVDRTGNARDVPDKFQLVFDAIETVIRRVHIDRQRVYIVGMSGGGKVSSILSTCFPDVFAGSVPIVGLASADTLDDSFGDHAMRYFELPRGARLAAAQRRRIAPMSGPADFNYREMRARHALMVEGGFSETRFFDHPEMGHVMPTAIELREALAWVDEPRRLDRRRSAAEATAALSEAADTEALHRIVATHPWTPAAWTAFERLEASKAPGR